MLTTPTEQAKQQARAQGTIAAARVLVATGTSERYLYPEENTALYEEAVGLALEESTPAGYGSVTFTSVTEYVSNDAGALRYQHVWEFSAIHVDE